MTPAERSTALLHLLAAIDQPIAEAESLASAPNLSYDQEEFIALHLHSGRIARERAGAVDLPQGSSGRPIQPILFIQ